MFRTSLYKPSVSFDIFLSTVTKSLLTPIPVALETWAAQDQQEVVQEVTLFVTQEMYSFDNYVTLLTFLENCGSREFYEKVDIYHETQREIQSKERGGTVVYLEKEEIRCICCANDILGN